MTDAEKREAARQFYQKWAGRGKEDEDDRSFWFDFLQMLGVDNITDRIDFQKKVVGPDGNTKKIDAYIPETKVLIEQKSLGIDLSKPQSGHNGMTPYEQAKMYDNSLPVSEKAKWIVLSNFAEIWVYDMDTRVPEPKKFSLDEIPVKYRFFDFLANTSQKVITQEMEISIKAGEFVGLIYDALLKQYIDPNSEKSQKSLNKLCVRLVFCLYAEDACVFGESGHMFHDYLERFSAADMRTALIKLFKILDTPNEKRDPYESKELLAFPYVNGGLFADEDIEIPNFTDELKDIILKKASAGFDWSKISPTIFGAVFESTLNPETRRSGGMHYTSIENIHKVIDPLFLDDLKAELKEIKGVQEIKTRNRKLKAYQEKLAKIKWLDPACGSGNFLTETYISVRRLENEVIKTLKGGQMQMVFDDETSPIKVSIEQFYGIEINDFAVTVAKTALWIAESQMLKETEDILLMHIEFLPLKTNACIIEGNALRMDWRYLHEEENMPTFKAKKVNLISKKDIDDVNPSFVMEPGFEYDQVNLIVDDIHMGPSEPVYQEIHYDYIMGNPPFVGARWMNSEQKADILEVFGKGWKNVGNLDYVSCWYKKASEIMANSDTRTALVSTNSVTQGESVANLWKPLFEMGCHIDFAYRTFRWDSEASIKAQVHCVIIGFSIAPNDKNRCIYSDGNLLNVKNINAYLLDADSIFIEKRTKPISKVSSICLGGQAIDDGNYILTEKEKEEIISSEPQAEAFIRPYMMGKDFIERKPRYCIWLVNADPMILKRCPKIMDRVNKVREFRLSSNRENTLKAAETPTLFATVLECQNDYIAIPKVSSGERRYIPIDFLSKNIIPGDKLFVMQNASLYEFGVLMSNVHMAWMRVVCGRLKSDYSYSNTIVYNNFPWCEPTDEQKKKIEKTAQGILDVRNLFPNSSLSALYDDLSMPPELRKAHNENNKAVMEAYGFSVKKMSEADCVAELMKMYKRLASKQDD